MPKPKTTRFWVIVDVEGKIVSGSNGSTKAMAWYRVAHAPEGVATMKTWGYRAVRARLEVE